MAAFATLLSGGVAALVSVQMATVQVTAIERQRCQDAVIEFLSITDEATSEEGYFGRPTQIDPREKMKEAAQGYSISRDRALVLCASDEAATIRKMDRIVDEAITKLLWYSMANEEEPILSQEGVDRLRDLKDELLTQVKEA